MTATRSRDEVAGLTSGKEVSDGFCGSRGYPWECRERRGPEEKFGGVFSHMRMMRI
jgi:hypothetical protein